MENFMLFFIVLLFLYVDAFITIMKNKELPDPFFRFNELKISSF